MSKKKHISPHGCPCGGSSYETCCGPYLSGKAAAEDVLTLMRSRYSAYVMGKEDYLRRTWFAKNCPPGQIIEKEAKTKWLNLKIIRHQEHEDRATVEFIASYKQNGKMQKLHEISRFIKADSKWYYFDGIFF